LKPTDEENSTKVNRVYNMTLPSILESLQDRIYTITSDNGLEFANHQNKSKALNWKTPNQVFYGLEMVA
jgi:IS30 family transposase